MLVYKRLRPTALLYVLLYQYRFRQSSVGRVPVPVGNRPVIAAAEAALPRGWPTSERPRRRATALIRPLHANSREHRLDVGGGAGDLWHAERRD